MPSELKYFRIFKAEPIEAKEVHMIDSRVGIFTTLAKLSNLNRPTWHSLRNNGDRTACDLICLLNN